MRSKSPEIPRPSQEISPDQERRDKLFELMDEAEKAETTPEKTKILREMKEVVEEGELPPERRLSPGEREKIDGIIERLFKREIDSSRLYIEIKSLGEKIVEPFLDKLESLEDQELKENDEPPFFLIKNLEGKVKQRDAERLANLLLRDPIALDTDSSTKMRLLRILGGVGTEKEIDKLVEYSRKVLKTDYTQGQRNVKPSRERKMEHQGVIKDTLIAISERRGKEEKNVEKRIRIKEKVVDVLKIIKDNISNL